MSPEGDTGPGRRGPGHIEADLRLLPGPPPHGTQLVRGACQPLQRAGQCRCITGGHQQAGLPVVHHLRNTACPRGRAPASE